jgi:hypothetical protein
MPLADEIRNGGLSGQDLMRALTGEFIVQEFNISIPNNNKVPIVAADASRYALIMHTTDTSGSFTLTTSPTPAVVGNLVLSGSLPPIIMTWRDWGPLCQALWYGRQVSGGAVGFGFFVLKFAH